MGNMGISSRSIGLVGGIIKEKVIHHGMIQIVRAGVEIHREDGNHFYSKPSITDPQSSQNQPSPLDAALVNQSRTPAE